MRPEDLLGLPLREAERIWRGQGHEVPQVRVTHDPRAVRTEETLRLVRVTDTEWTVACFLDGKPKDREEGPDGSV